MRRECRALEGQEARAEVVELHGRRWAERDEEFDHSVHRLLPALLCSFELGMRGCSYLDTQMEKIRRRRSQLFSGIPGESLTPLKGGTARGK